MADWRKEKILFLSIPIIELQPILKPQDRASLFFRDPEFSTSSWNPSSVLFCVLHTYLTHTTCSIPAFLCSHPCHHKHARYLRGTPASSLSKTSLESIHSSFSFSLLSLPPLFFFLDHCSNLLLASAPSYLLLLLTYFYLLQHYN